MTLRIGVARRDVSPTHPVQLAGFGRRRNALISRVAHPIHVRIAVLDDGERSLALVSGEFLNWSSESDERFRAVVAAGSGVDPEDIMFSATHTHSAPQLSHDHARLLGVVGPRYLDELEEHLALAAREAAGARREVTLSRATGHHALAWQRREGLDASRAIDERLTVVRFDAGRDLVACLVHYACHPVVSAEDAVSGDFLGVAMSSTERATGAVAFPLQGCAGDVDPAGAAMAGLERAAAIGEDFAGAVMALLEKDPEPLPAGPLSAAWASAELPIGGAPSEEELEEAARGTGLDADWAQGLRDRPWLRRPVRDCRLQLWSLGPGLQLLGLNGEATSPYGLRIRERSGGTALPVAYANGMIGYLPTAAQLAAGGYEVHESARCYLIPGTFDPAIEQRIDAAVDGLLDMQEPRGR